MRRLPPRRAARHPLPDHATRRLIATEVVPRVVEVVGHQVAWRRAAGRALSDAFGAGYLHAAVAQGLGETLLAIDGAYAATFERVASRVLLPEEAWAVAQAAGDALSDGDEAFDAGVDAAIDDTVRWREAGTFPDGWR